MRSATLLLTLITLLVSQPLFAQEWNLEKDKKGIKVYTRKLETHKFRQSRATATIKGSVDAVVDKIFDYPTYPDWSPMCMEAHAVSKTPDRIVSYSLNNAPWPVSNRDIVIQNDIARGSDGSVRIDMKALEGTVPERKDAVRMTFFEGYWLIKPQDDGTVEVLYESIMDPAGSVPAWVANMAVEQTPFDLLESLREQVEP